MPRNVIAQPSSSCSAATRDPAFKKGSIEMPSNADADRNLEVLRRHLHAENAHDMDATLATLHPDCLFEDAMRGLVYRGHAEARNYYSFWWQALDLEVVSERRHVVTDGNVVSEA